MYSRRGFEYLKKKKIDGQRKVKLHVLQLLRMEGREGRRTPLDSSTGYNSCLGTLLVTIISRYRTQAFGLSATGLQMMELCCILTPPSLSVSTAFCLPPKGGQGGLMSPLCLELQSCHLIPLLLPESCFSFCLIFLPACWPILMTFFLQKILQHFSSKDRLFCMASV